MHKSVVTLQGSCFHNFEKNEPYKLKLPPYFCQLRAAVEQIPWIYLFSLLQGDPGPRGADGPSGPDGHDVSLNPKCQWKPFEQEWHFP